MRYFDSDAEQRPGQPARHDQRSLLDGPSQADQSGLWRPQPDGGEWRGGRPAARRAGAGSGGSGGSGRPRDHAGLLEPIATTTVLSPDLLQRPGAAGPGGSPAPVHAPAAWLVPATLVPATRASADGRRPWPAWTGGQRASGYHGQDVQDQRPYRRVADGLAITPRVSVVVPVKNEAPNLPSVFATIPSWVDEVVLVDGRSTDGTIEVARRLRPDVKVVLQGGVGKGDALVAGFTASAGDIIVAIDGDGSTDGAEIVRFVSALIAGADFAKGSRFSSAGASDDITGIRRLGNKILNLMVNRLFHTTFSDLCYGYNAFWARHLGELALDSPGFEVETLMSIRAAEAGLRIYEVPSHERLRRHGVSNLSAIKDGWRILRLIVSEKRAARRSRARRLRPFMAPGYLAQDAPGVALPLRPAAAQNGHGGHGGGPGGAHGLAGVARPGPGQVQE